MSFSDEAREVFAKAEFPAEPQKSEAKISIEELEVFNKLVKQFFKEEGTDKIYLVDLVKWVAERSDAV